MGSGIGRFSQTDPVPDEFASRPGLEGLFWSHRGSIVHKWHHYLPIYEEYFSPFVGSEVRFLEIGVSKGGSLELWRKYLGPSANIFGIDIDPECESLDGRAGRVRIGSQDDPEFLRRVVSEMGGVDVVLDDGSHLSRHIRASFETLFPLLAEPGLYFIEDLHATYFQSHEGGYRSPGSFIDDIRQMYDDMHHWYHSEGQKVSAAADRLKSIHLYDSIAVLRKETVAEPRHSMLGESP